MLIGATDELRRLLDERGTRWWPDADCEDTNTCWMAGEYGWRVSEYDGDLIVGGTYIKCLTPEQAIEITVERETCHTVSMDCFGNPPYNQSGLNGNDMACGCSECGVPWSTLGIFRGNKLRHNFRACPLCGRKVVG